MASGNKISLIIKREYLSRVKKKSFLIMTLLGPILMASVIFSRLILENLPDEAQTVLVADESGLFKGKLEETDAIKFDYSNKNINQEKKEIYKTDYNILVYIPENILQGSTIQVYYKKQPSLETNSFIKNQINSKLQDMKLVVSGIDVEKLAQTKTNIKVLNTKISETGEEENSDATMKVVVGFIGGFLIYLFIFLYGAQVMRGVIEEKTNRIVEVIITSVKPFELMAGKIIGIALVGLTQFLLWVLLTFAISNIVIKQYAVKKYSAENVEQTFKKGIPESAKQEIPESEIDTSGLIKSMGSVNFVTIILLFIFYFIGGYLLYGALFAAIGSAVDNEADTQQFMLPITIPLIVAFIVAQVVVQNPESKLAFWFSVIPFTSPVVMMVRVPFGIPIWEVALSMFMLVAGFIFTTWLAGKIYRVGILMYGKKPSFKELSKWIFYKG